MELNLLLKSLDGGTIVTCPHCGYQFDYDAEPEQTFSQQVVETAAQYTRWMTEDIVRAEIARLKPEIRAEVVALLDTFKGDRKDFTEKSITELMHFVRCPHCWSRVYRANNILADESTQKEDTEASKNDTEGTELKHVQPSFFQKLNGLI